jgi:hypothetical protein
MLLWPADAKQGVLRTVVLRNWRGNFRSSAPAPRSSSAAPAYRSPRRRKAGGRIAIGGVATRRERPGCAEHSARRNAHVAGRAPCLPRRARGPELPPRRSALVRRAVRCDAGRRARARCGRWHPPLRSPNRRCANAVSCGGPALSTHRSDADRPDRCRLKRMRLALKTVNAELARRGHTAVLGKGDGQSADDQQPYSEAMGGGVPQTEGFERKNSSDGKGRPHTCAKDTREKL